MQEFDAEGVLRRWPGQHKIYRAVLQAEGYGESWSADGHEKLGILGLGLGSVGMIGSDI